VLIQTAEHDSKDHNVLTKAGLLRHVDLMQEIVGLEVERFGMWVLKKFKSKISLIELF